MNNHFEDASYHLKRAGEHVKRGVVEELEPVEAKVRELTGREAEPEPGRVDRLHEELRTIDVERFVETARENVYQVRGRRT